jgi:glyoxylase-like metal-dependent hydrolase (beta-lactamase superfamily II)
VTSGQLNRREALCAIASAAGGLYCAGGAFGSVVDGFDLSQPLTAQRLTSRIAVFGGAGGNVVAALGSEGLALVDGGLEARSAELLELVRREMGRQAIDVLFNTHWHEERVGSNLALGKAGAKIVAHENTRLWLNTVFQRPWDERPFSPLPKAAQPNDTFYTKGELAFGDQPVEYGYMLQSHTDGDIYTFFPAENVLVTGGVVCADRWPLIDWWTGGWMLGMVDGLDVLIGVANDTTTVVPGSGPLLTKADLVAQRDMYLVIYERLMKLFFAARSPAEAVDAGPTKEFRPDWGDPSRFVTLAFESIWGQLTPDG